MNTTLLKAAALGALMLGISGATHASQITNGGFENGFSGWTLSGLTCSGTGSNASAASGGCVGMDSDPGPHSGSAAAYLGTANGNGVVSQSVSTVAGTNYNLDFFLANGAYGGISTPNDLLVQWDGQTLLHLT